MPPATPQVEHFRRYGVVSSPGQLAAPGSMWALADADGSDADSAAQGEPARGREAREAARAKPAGAAAAM